MFLSTRFFKLRHEATSYIIHPNGSRLEGHIQDNWRWNLLRLDAMSFFVAPCIHQSWMKLGKLDHFIIWIMWVRVPNEISSLLATSLWDLTSSDLTTRPAPTGPLRRGLNQRPRPGGRCLNIWRGEILFIYYTWWNMHDTCDVLNVKRGFGMIRVFGLCLEWED